jgi:putative phosphoribosyl transferase
VRETDVRPFRNRREAGCRLAAELADIGPDPLVLALPRGGVPVAAEVARALGAPLDVFLVRKLGVPGHEELAMGAIASGGSRVLNDTILRDLGLGARDIAAAEAREARELARREAIYRGSRPFPDLRGRTVIVVDDGLATGATMRAAVTALRQLGPGAIVVAVPVAPPDTLALLRREADDVVCVLSPEPFGGVGRWYESFPQMSDAEVQALLERASKGT